MLFGRNLVLFATHDLLRVVDQLHREEQCNQGWVDRVDDWVVSGKENDGQDTENEKNPGAGEQVHPCNKETLKIT